MGRCSQKIAVILAGLSERCQAEIWKGISREAFRAGVSSFAFLGEFILKQYRCNEGMPPNPERQIFYSGFKEFVHRENFGGAIILSGAVTHLSQADELERLVRGLSSLPLVSIGIPIKDGPSILVDNREQVKELVSHLITVHNRTRIAYVQGPQGHREAEERYAGYCEALERHRIAFNDNLVVPGSFSELSGREAVRHLMSSNHPFDALVGADDFTALGALKELEERGVALPGEVMLAGFDDCYAASLCTPALTTVRQDFFEQGARAVRTLLELIEGKAEVPRQITVPGSLILRESCLCGAIGVDKSKKRLPELYGTVKPPQESESPEIIAAPGRLEEIGRAILTTITLDELVITLYRELPTLAIDSSYLVLFEQEKREMARLVMGYNREGRFERESNVFSVANLLPGSLMEELSRENYIFLPLAFGSESYGYIIFEQNPEERPDIYETLRLYISSVLKSIYLVKSLHRASREKIDFFINMAHEIKTPLTLINNYLDDYIERVGSSRELVVVQENVGKLTADIVNLLDSEKLERGRSLYDHSEVMEISELVEKRCSLFKKLGDREGVELKSAIEKGLYCRFDPLGCERVLNNLLDNALRYNRPGGSVTVSLSQVGEQVELMIKDRGIGMAADQLENIFKPYYQISHRKRNIQGIGMGLNIVKKIVDSGRGEIKVKSRPGMGTTFTILLPAAVESDWLTPEETMLPQPPLDYYREKRIEPAPYSSEKSTILIVEDNIYMLSYLVSSLKSDYNIYYGTNGREALELIPEISRPQLIISDIMMDRMDGYSFFRKIKERREFSSIPFIFLTAKNSPEETIKGLSEGAVDYIGKPFKIEELKARIVSLINLLSTRERERGRELEERVLKAIRAPESSGESEPRLEENCRSYGITRREREILRLIFEGYESKEIGYKLDITFNTVRSHIRHIYEKCRVQNRVELINLFR